MAASRKFSIPEDEFVLEKKVKEVPEDMKPEQFVVKEEKAKVIKSDKYRFNLALDGDVAEYVKRESKVRGLTITDFLNRIIRAYMANPANKHYVD